MPATLSTSALAAPTRLTIEELTELVDRLATDPAVREQIHFEADRVTVEIQRDELSEAWLICWGAGHDTGFHDHDGSDAVIGVVDGSIREERMGADGAPALAGDYPTGARVTVGPFDIHRMVNPAAPDGSTRRAVTIHAYSPPLRGMGAYARGTDGLLRRAPLDASTKLTPLD